MKKIYSTLFTLAAIASLSASAQQLPNAGFENGWAKTTPYTGGASKETDGLSPESWTIAHVAGYKFIATWMGTTLVGGQEAPGYNGSQYAAVITNNPNSIAKSQKVPGYITLGTPFNTANSSGNNKDGGSFGGIDFAYRPDALSIQYKRTQAANTSENGTVVAYLWKGTVKQANVRVSIGSSPTKITMENRDRNILGMETAYGDTPEKSADFETIATINHAVVGSAADWTQLVVPFDYTSTAVPAKINVIFGAGNYFSTSPEEGNSMTIDDVKLIYYSRLASLSVNGTALEGFASDNYTYTVDSEMPEESAFVYTTMGDSGCAKATVALDKENAMATITVTNTNQGGTDIDGEASHVYTIQFNKTQAPEPTEPEGTKYTGSLNIKIEMLEIDVTQPDKVYIKDNGDGTCTFILPDFTLTLPDMEPANFGDIKVDNVTVTTNADGSKSYSGSVTGMSLADGEIIADVTISGTEKDGNLVMNISVMWEGIPIDVTFTNVVEPTEPEGTKYTGTLNIKIETLEIDVTQPDKIYINDGGNGTCTFLLPDFTLTLPDMEPANFGDIKVDNVTVTTNADGSKSYSGSVTGMSLADGEIIADVTISGTEKDGNLVMNISVMWEGIPIDVTFTNGSASIDDITADNENAPVEYYNLQGIRVNGDNLTPGIYIVRKGTEVRKIYVR